MIVNRDEYFSALDCVRQSIKIMKNGARIGFYSERYEEGAHIPIAITSNNIKIRKIIERCLHYSYLFNGNFQVKAITEGDLNDIITTILTTGGISEDDYFIEEVENSIAVIVEDYSQYDKIYDLLSHTQVGVYDHESVFHCEECDKYYFVDNGYEKKYRLVSSYGIVCVNCFRENLMEYLLDEPSISGIYTSKGCLVKGMHALEPDDLPGEPGEVFEEIFKEGVQACVNTEKDTEKFNQYCDKKATYVIARDPVDMMFSNYFVYKLRG